jgi:3-oxoacyl-[acyl-carrier-protein] synthase II
VTTAAVVVSGMGVVSPFGAGREALAAGLACGRPLLTEVDRSAGRHHAGGARMAALVGRPDLSRWLRPAAARRMSGPSRLAVTAALMALEDAGLAGVERGWDETTVCLSTAFGPADHTERLFATIDREGPQAASPFLFTESVANAPAAQIAIACRARGPNLTLTQREAGPLIAVARAAREVACGRAGRALAGSVEEMTPLLHALLDRFGALARAGDGLEEAARPFDRRRNGLLAGEGAAVLVLERERDVVERGGRVLARVLGGSSAFDPGASRVGWGDGVECLAAAASRLLGAQSAAVDRVVSGASGSRGGDRLEARVLRCLFGGRMPTVLAPKAVTGEYGGGLLAAAVLAAAGGRFGPTHGFVEADPELGVVPHAGGALGRGRVLVSSLAAGGAGAWLLLEGA